MFAVEILPAQQGDAIWIEYGSRVTPKRILIDCGTPPTANIVRTHIERLDRDQRQFELLVVTHIDTDHIGGVLRLLADLPPGLAFGDVWFNGWRHLQDVPSSALGPVDGEILSYSLEKRGWPWNAAFAARAITVGREAVQLAGGMSLTVLSPGEDQLRRLRANWRTVVKNAGLDPNDPNRAARLLKKAIRKGVAGSILGPQRPDVQKLAGTAFQSDTTVANGSTIALLVEYEGHSCLLTGDGFPDVMLSAIRRLVQERGQANLQVDAVKVPHHGSRYNISNEFLATIRSTQYLISTNGAIFGHPDDEAVARIVWANRLSGCQLYFNYSKAAGTADWAAAKCADPVLKRRYRYQALFAGSSGTRLDIAS